MVIVMSRLLLLLMPSLSDFLLFAQFLSASSSVLAPFAIRPSSPSLFPSSFPSSDSPNNGRIPAELQFNPVYRQMLKQRLWETVRRRRLTLVAHHQRNCFFSPINCHLPPTVGTGTSTSSRNQ